MLKIVLFIFFVFGNCLIAQSWEDFFNYYQEEIKRTGIELFFSEKSKNVQKSIRRAAFDKVMAKWTTFYEMAKSKDNLEFNFYVPNQDYLDQLKLLQSLIHDISIPVFQRYIKVKNRVELDFTKIKNFAMITEYDEINLKLFKSLFYLTFGYEVCLFKMLMDSKALKLKNKLSKLREDHINRLLGSVIPYFPDFPADTPLIVFANVFLNEEKA